MLKNLEGHSACILTRALRADFSQSFDVQDRAPEAETTEGTKMQSPLLSLNDRVRFITTGVSVCLGSCYPFFCALSCPSGPCQISATCEPHAVITPPSPVSSQQLSF